MTRLRSRPLRVCVCVLFLPQPPRRSTPSPTARALGSAGQFVPNHASGRLAHAHGTSAAVDVAGGKHGPHPHASRSPSVFSAASPRRRATHARGGRPAGARRWPRRFAPGQEGRARAGRLAPGAARRARTGEGATGGVARAGSTRGASHAHCIHGTLCIRCGRTVCALHTICELRGCCPSSRGCGTG